MFQSEFANLPNTMNELTKSIATRLTTSHELVFRVSTISLLRISEVIRHDSDQQIGSTPRSLDGLDIHVFVTSDLTVRYR